MATDPLVTPDSVSAVVPSTTPVAVPAAIADPRLATSQGRLDYLNTRFRGLVMGLDVVALLVFGAGALVFTLIPRAFTWVRWGGMRVAWSPDLTPVLTPRSRVWFAWFCLAAAAAGEGVRLTSLSEKLVTYQRMNPLASQATLALTTATLMPEGTARPRMLRAAFTSAFSV
jgi:hypothetical protein